MAEITAAELQTKIAAIRTAIDALVADPSAMVDVAELDVQLKRGQQLPQLLALLKYYEQQLEKMPGIEFVFVTEDGFEPA